MIKYIGDGHEYIAKKPYTENNGREYIACTKEGVAHEIFIPIENFFCAAAGIQIYRDKNKKTSLEMNLTPEDSWLLRLIIKEAFNPLNY